MIRNPLTESSITIWAIATSRSAQPFFNRWAEKPVNEQSLNSDVSGCSNPGRDDDFEWRHRVFPNRKQNRIIGIAHRWLWNSASNIRFGFYGYDVEEKWRWLKVRINRVDGTSGLDLTYREGFQSAGIDLVANCCRLRMLAKT